MCLRAFYMLYLDLTVKSAAEKVLWYLETLVCGIFSLQNAVLFTTLEAPTDFTTLVLSIK